MKCLLFPTDGQNTVQQWAFKSKSALAVAKMWDFKGHMLKVDVL